MSPDLDPDLDLVPGAMNEEDAGPDYGALAESILAGGDQARLERMVELEREHRPRTSNDGHPFRGLDRGGF
jgi:hypothetical protein